MPTAELANDRIRLLDWQWQEADLIKTIPGARYAESSWHVPLSWAACKQLRGTFGNRLTVGPDLERWAWHELEHRVQPAVTAHERTDAPGLADLYPFQRVGVQFLRTAGGAILADEMGTGKTVQVCAGLAELETGPFLVVAPKSLLRVWEDHVRAWTSYSPHVISGTSTQRRKQLDAAADDAQHAVVIINYDVLRHHSRLAPYGSNALKRCMDHGGDDPELTHAKCEAHAKELNGWDFAATVWDEAHRLKDPNAKWTRASWAIAHETTERPCWALTGTPVSESPDDLWSLLHLVAPHEWPYKTTFIDRYCLSTYNPFAMQDTIVGLNPHTQAEFHSIVDSRMLRRSKQQVLPDLPPKMPPERRYHQLKPAQRRVYKELRDDMLAELESGELLVTVNPLSSNSRLIQAAAATLEIDHDEDGHEHVRLVEPSAKLDTMMEVLDDLGASTPVVVFAESRQLIELASARLAKKGVTHGLVHGQIEETDRHWAVDQFQNGNLRCILLTLGAGGEGLTLTRAAHVVYLQRPYSSLRSKQSEDRVHRPGQLAEKVTLIELIAEDTIEERVLEILDDKNAMSEQVLRDRFRELV